MIELKLCPFCGDSAFLFEYVYAFDTYCTTTHVVECNGCHATTFEYDTEEEAADAWNMRAVEVVHGRWIKYKLGWDDWALRFKCSVCDHRIYEQSYNYCPNCGAKMDGGN